MSETEVQSNPYGVIMNGSINGQPHSIEFDTRDVLARRYELRGEHVSEEQLLTNSLELASDIRRMQDAPSKIRTPSRVERVAERIGSFIRR